MRQPSVWCLLKCRVSRRNGPSGIVEFRGWWWLALSAEASRTFRGPGTNARAARLAELRESQRPIAPPLEGTREREGSNGPVTVYRPESHRHAEEEPCARESEGARVLSRADPGARYHREDSARITSLSLRS